MTPPTRRRRFDATWLPFGMLIGFTVGIGFGLSFLDNLFLGALVGLAVGSALGIMLGLRGAGSSSTDEDAEDDRYRREHGDPGPQDGRSGPSSAGPR